MGTSLEVQVRMLEMAVNRILSDNASTKLVANKAAQDASQSGPVSGPTSDGFLHFQVQTDVPAAAGATVGSGGSVRILDIVSGVRVNRMNHDTTHQDIASPTNPYAVPILAKTYGILRNVYGVPTIIQADCAPAASFAADGAIP